MEYPESQPAARLDGDTATVPAKSLRSGETERTKHFGKVPEDLLLDKDAPPHSVRLYAFLHWRSLKNGYSYYGRERMMEELGIAKPTFDKSLNYLRTTNRLWVLRRGLQKSNCYYLPTLEERESFPDGPVPGWLKKRLMGNFLDTPDGQETYHSGRVRNLPIPIERDKDEIEEHTAETANAAPSGSVKNWQPPTPEDYAKLEADIAQAEKDAGLYYDKFVKAADELRKRFAEEHPTTPPPADETEPQWANRKIQEFHDAVSKRYGPVHWQNFGRVNKVLCNRIKSGASRLDVGMVLVEALNETEDEFVAALRGDIPKLMSDYWFNRLLTRATERERNGA